MKILVINGSPKGQYSTTLHTCLYLQKKFPQEEFAFINAGQKIKSLERDFQPAIEAMKAADILLFSYPVYTFLAPYQLHRFIEDNCEDMGNRFIDGLSADMDDLLTENVQFSLGLQRYVRNLQQRELSGTFTRFPFDPYGSKPSGTLLRPQRYIIYRYVQKSRVNCELPKS